MMNINTFSLINKSWGYEKWIHNDKDYCGKLLHFNKGKNCHFHYHRLKKETFYLSSGKVIVRYSNIDKQSIENAEEILLNPGEKFEVPVGLCHKIIALEDSDVFEFSTQHFDSDSYYVEEN